VQGEYAGSVYPGWRLVPSEAPELIGLVVAFIILLITFGAFVTAGLPILTAIVGVVITLMGVTAIAAVVNIASASTTVALMLGLCCGIDYGLFILSRHRNNLLTGLEPEDAAALAAGTAGSSVAVRSRLWYHPQWFAMYVPDADIEGERLQRSLSTPPAEPGAGDAPRPDPAH
jgi:RND superfamily putative drug exporter